MKSFLVCLSRRQLLIVSVFLLSLFLNKNQAQGASCFVNQNGATQFVEELSTYLEDNEEEIIQDALLKKTSPHSMIQAQDLKAGYIVETGDNEIKQIVAVEPYKASFLVFPKTKIQITKALDKKCGLEMEILSSTPSKAETNIKSKVVSIGEHQENNACDEISTSELTAIPTGTTYSAEVNALNEALMASMAETGQALPDEGSEENLSVKKGSIQVKLRKVYQKSSIKVTKTSYSWSKKTSIEKKSSKNKIAKGKTKTEVKTIAANEKINLKAGSRIKAKKNKKAKTQVADIEIIDPSGM